MGQRLLLAPAGVSGTTVLRRPTAGDCGEYDVWVFGIENGQAIIENDAIFTGPASCPRTARPR